MILSLPRELLGEIVSHLWCDIPALRACTLSIPRSREVCQKLLFFHIEIYALRHSEKFQKTLISSPHIADYVRCLKIGKRREKLEWLSKDATSLLFILPQLQNLRSFYLHCDTLKWIPSQIPQKVVDCFADLMTLPSLTHVDMVNIPLPLLNYGLHLKHVSSPYVGHRGSLAPSPAFSKTPTNEPVYLDTLDIGPFALVEVIGWFLNPENNLRVSRLKKLSLVSHFEDDWVEISRILDTCRHTLEEFAFVPDTGTYSVLSPSPDPLDLTRLVALRALHVRLSIDKASMFMQDAVYNPSPWYIHQIERLPPSNVIENITIHVLANEYSHHINGSFDWTWWRTASAVLLKNLPRLRAVDVGVHCGSETDYDLCVPNILRYTKDLQDAGIFRLEGMIDSLTDFCMHPPFSLLPPFCLIPPYSGWTRKKTYSYTTKTP